MYICIYDTIIDLYDCVLVFSVFVNVNIIKRNSGGAERAEGAET